MKLSPDLQPLTFNYPSPKKIPRNLLHTPLKQDFQSTKKKFSFKEQYANEKFPHKIHHISYQFGTIKGKRAVQFFLNKHPIRITYSHPEDPYTTELMTASPPRTRFPPNTVSSPIARSLRELGLKWIIDQFFAHLDFLCFDEPILEGVNPDCFALPVSQANEILHLDTHNLVEKTETGQKMVDVDIQNGIFIEVKAYHDSSIVGEKEMLQAFNYAVKGGKALLITTGTLGDLKSLDILNEDSSNPDHDYSTGYDPAIYQKFTTTVKKKFRQLIKRIDMSASQDSFDTRGIYVSVGSKLGKYYKYTKVWPKKVTYQLLNTPGMIMDFIKRGNGLGIVEPMAFEELLDSLHLIQASGLFRRICDTYLEEIILNPSLLYPNRKSKTKKPSKSSKQ